MKRRYCVVFSIAFAAAGLLYAHHGIARVLIGRDNNAASNPFVQPQTQALAGGGIDQSLEFGDAMYGGESDELFVGGLGVDVLMGAGGDDILLGGLEHFHPRKGDFIFGGDGDDIVIWAPGDGSDFMDGGPGEDVLILGLVGEVVDGRTVFRVSNDQRAGNVFVNSSTRLPAVEVTNAPGFCEVLDRSTRDGQAQLDAMGLEHLVRFFLRDEADSFERGTQNGDNGLRQTMHLKNMEALVCASRDGRGPYEVFDLTVSPPQRIPLNRLSMAPRLEAILR